MTTLGIPEVKQAIGRITRQMILEAERAAIVTQEQVVRKAKQDAPIGTPQSTGIPNYIVSEAYKRSIRKLSPTKTFGFFVAEIKAGGGDVINPNTGREVDYAERLERGWSGQAPNGVMIPSLISQKGFLLNEIIKRLKRVK